MLLLRNGVLLLADIFQNYIIACISAFGNNQIYSYSTSVFTKKASLKGTEVELI